MERLGAKLINHDPRLEGRVNELRPHDEGAVAVVEFPLAEEPRMQIAGLTLIEFSAAALDNPIQVSARVLGLARNEACYRCEFQLDKETRMMLLPSGNRRQAFRVKPSTDSPIEVALHTLDGKRIARAQVSDISATGVSLFFSGEEEPKCSSLWEFRLSLRLPREGEVADLVSTVRQRRLVGSVIVYGMSFDPDATDDFGRKQKRIRAYVMRRQREMLVARSDSHPEDRP